MPAKVAMRNSGILWSRVYGGFLKSLYNGQYAKQVKSGEQE
jgi:hypothetical protein